MKNLKKFAFSILTIAFFTACSSDDDTVIIVEDITGNAKITFDAKVGSTDFALDTPFSIDGNSYQFDHLRYWVSNISLVNSDNETHSIQDSYFLLEETKAISVQDGAYTYPAKKRETIDLVALPSGSYTKIRFSVGVDETFNNNLSLQAGELSQLNGMTNISWMWHTSYIFSSLKGKNVATNGNILVETGLNANYRTVEITLPTALVVSSSTTGTLNINVDVAKILQNIDLAATPTVSASTPAAMTTVANNFKDNVFTVISVQ